ncbi:MAG: hypothetical protein ACHQTF_10240 [Gemmatimonadales bacterium]
MTTYRDITGPHAASHAQLQSRMRSRLGRRHGALALGVTMAALVAACSNPTVPNFNALNGFPHTAAALQSEVTGAFDGVRTDIGNYNLFMEGMARNSAYFTASEQRFVSVTTGESFAGPGDVFMGPGVWDFYFNAIEGIDTIIGNVGAITVTTPSGSGPMPAAQREALFGAMETLKAMYYMYIAQTRDTLGVPINEVGRPASQPVAPILCNKDVWSQIVAMLDSASDSLTVAGASATFPFTMPPGFALVSANAGSFLGLTRALRGKARIEFAYSTGRPTDTLTVGTPNLSQIDSAVTDITGAAPIFSSALSSSEAVAANDLGVFHVFSTTSNDVQNPINTNAAAMWVLFDALNDIDTTDLRFTAKFGEGAGPTSVGADIGSTWHYVNNISGSEPIPLVRNVELQLLLARAHLALGDFATAIALANAVRTNVGGLPAATVSADYVHARNFILAEQRVSTMSEALGDRLDALRDLNLVKARDTTWSATGGPDGNAAHLAGVNKDFQTSVVAIPQGESDARNGSIAPQCQ